jgi:hypothetical protein
MKRVKEKLAKEQLQNLIDEFCTLQTSEEEAAFSIKMRETMAAKTQEEKAIFARIFVSGAKEAMQEADDLLCGNRIPSEMLAQIA